MGIACGWFKEAAIRDARAEKPLLASPIKFTPIAC
jgi:hypothetical protein